MRGLARAGFVGHDYSLWDWFVWCQGTVDVFKRVIWATRTKPDRLQPFLASLFEFLFTGCHWICWDLGVGVIQAIKAHVGWGNSYWGEVIVLDHQIPTVFNQWPG